MAQLSFIKSTMQDMSYANLIKGQIFYCTDENKYFYDITHDIRMEVDNIHFFEADVDMSTLLYIDGHIYIIGDNPDTQFFKYAHKSFGSSPELIPVLTTEDVFDIFNAYEELVCTTLFRQNGTKYAPTTVASQVWASDGVNLEDKLRAITRINRAVVEVEVTEEAQKVFTIPYPFDNYFSDPGNSMDVYIGSTRVSETRYSVEGATLTFLEWDEGIELGRKLTFIFWYNVSIINAAGDKMRFDGRYLVNQSVTVDKLFNASNDFRYADERAIPTCRAMRDMFDHLSDKIDMFTYGLTAYGTTINEYNAGAEHVNDFKLLAPNFNLIDGSCLEITLHKPMLDGIKLKVNLGEYYPIYYNNAPVTKGLFSAGDVVCLRFNGVKNIFHICSEGAYTSRTVHYVYTATGGENIIKFDIPEYTSGLNTVKVYQNNLRLFENINYTVMNRQISLINYTAAEGDMFYFEVDVISKLR